ncbi:A disintegrin and metalloproteinase with thrombospondin motifs 6 [Plakobranchus ocellatus]|uniref:A disintegrin and metalloproteinase with thrombospondin motifs 6 n=1 Tax=Plakobranchus ocellatus TaxID=259542 RepID=A0AAV4BSC5_9GAST|nr:A disintegrin and metalloproteinase with thrombospondin motifs 6 [Plakobranchus ocellatus]
MWFDGNEERHPKKTKMLGYKKNRGSFLQLKADRQSQKKKERLVSDNNFLCDEKKKLHKSLSSFGYDDLLAQLNHFETVIPQLVDESGDFLSYHVTHSGVQHHHYQELKARTKRSVNSQRNHNGDRRELKTNDWRRSNRTRSQNLDPNLRLDGSDQAGRNSVFYKLRAYGREFHFNLSLNTQLLAKDFVVEFWGEDEAKRGLGRVVGGGEDIWGCHYTGVTLDLHASDAAISNCNGLHGIFSTDTDDYFVEPLWNHTNVVGVEGHPHIVYSKASLKLGDISRHCGVREDRWRRKMQELYRKRRRRNRYNNILREYSPHRKWRPKRKLRRMRKRYQYRLKGKRRMRRSVSKARHVETMVVIDKKMMDHHRTYGHEETTAALTAYVLTVMNIVAKLFHNPTIGNAINIIVTRLVVITSEKGKDLPEINYHADKSLDSFCKWQYRLQQKKGNNSDNHYHHDNAILMTRYDICTYKNDPCGTLGLAPVESMCDQQRSCNINQDIGLASAFTIAHEIGHNFGMLHDGADNQCGRPGNEPARLMASRLTSETSPFHWSSCSRRYVTDFLDSGKGRCLDNVPLKREVYPRDLPGDTYDMDAQCRLQFGPTSTACMRQGACGELWCIDANSSCVTYRIPAAEGTECQISEEKNGWCYQGNCRNPKYEAVTVHGSWGEWGSWGECSRTCEGGVLISERKCDNPEPKDGGRYCVGQRKRYKSCNLKPCPEGEPNFRQVQCSEHDSTAFRGRYYKWVPYSGEQVKPCSLVCMAEGYSFYTERSPKVKDGTKCFPDQPHVCINGKCQFVGCDGHLGSNVKEDNCRVCGGDNSTCKTISGLFDKPLPTGEYQEIVKIPKGAMHVKVTEAKVSKNYLALKDTRDKYFINGEWTIDWPRKFPIASTVFHYKLADNEPESLLALGPTGEDLVVMMLLQEDNRGIEYQYNLPVNTSDREQHDISLYVWSHLVWSDCSKSCSRGRTKKHNLDQTQNQNGAQRKS